MDNQAKVYVLGDGDCDFEVIAEKRKQMNQIMQELSENYKKIDPISLALLRCSWSEGAKGLVIVRPDQSQHFVNFGSTVIKSLSKVDPKSKKCVEEILIAGGFRLRSNTLSIVSPEMHTVRSRGVSDSWQYYVLTFDITQTNEKGSLMAGWHSNIGLFFDGFLSEGFEWFDKFRKTAEEFFHLQFRSGIQFCGLCGVELVSDDFDSITRAFHCKKCTLAQTEAQFRKNARKSALSKLKHRAEGVLSGIRTIVKCTLCGTEFDRMTILLDGSSLPFCSNECSRFYRSYHSEDRRVYTPQLLRLCLVWQGKDCAIPDCENNQPKKKNSWNVCSEHFIRISNSLKKQNHNRLEILKQFEI